MVADCEPNDVATGVPRVRELLDDGLQFEKAGMLERALDCYGNALDAATDPALISESLRRQSHAHRMRCDWERALAAARHSADVAAAAELHELTAEALNAEAAVHQTRGDFELAVPLYERIMKIADTDRLRGVALQNLAATCAMQNDLEEAERHFRQAFDYFDRADYAWGRAHVLNNLGTLALDLGKRAAAESLLHDAIVEAKQVGDLDLVATARINLAETLLARGSLDTAEQLANAALGHFTTAGNQWRRLDCLRLLGDLQLLKDAPDVARRFYGAALKAAEQIGAKADQQKLQDRLDRLDG